MASSFQVLNAAGFRTRQFRLPVKRDFSGAPWIVRRLSHQRPKARCFSIQEIIAAREATCDVDEALKNLEQKENPSYQDALKPLFVAVKKMASDRNDTLNQLANLFCENVAMIVTCSAEFFNRAAALPEADLLPSPREHYRALTNYWVYLIAGSIIHDTDDDIPFDPAAYAYSFLYPYTDDLLDGEGVKPSSDNSCERNKKKLVSNISRKVQMGNSPECLAFESFDEQTCKREQRVYELLDEVLSTQATPVKESIQAINTAQLASLKQHVNFDEMRVGVRSLSIQEKRTIFNITINKGAASVLPNAYFHSPDGITKEQAELVAVFGYMGQFINDIEGLFEDLKDKSLTPALISYIKHGNLDCFVEHLLKHVQLLHHRAPRRFPSLPLNRIQMMLGATQFRLLMATSLLHDTHKGILSQHFIEGVEARFGIPFFLLTARARLEQEAFGGNGLPNKVSTPEIFRSFVLEKAEEWKSMILPIREVRKSVGIREHSNIHAKNEGSCAAGSKCEFLVSV